jgi:hypothetical protein
MRKTMLSLLWVGSGLLVIVGLIVASYSTASAALDGTTPLLCSVTTMTECDASGQCENQSPTRHPDFPSMLKINVPGRVITTAAADSRKTEIKSVTRLDGRLILNGGENGRGWAATIAEDTGRMAAGIVADDFTLALFGTCTSP